MALLKNCQIVGVFWGAYTGREPAEHQENLAELMDMFKKGQLKPHISATYPLEQAADALTDMGGTQSEGQSCPYRSAIELQ